MLTILYIPFKDITILSTFKTYSFILQLYCHKFYRPFWIVDVENIAGRILIFIIKCYHSILLHLFRCCIFVSRFLFRSTFQLRTDACLKREDELNTRTKLQTTKVNVEILRKHALRGQFTFDKFTSSDWTKFNVSFTVDLVARLFCSQAKFKQ